MLEGFAGGAEGVLVGVVDDDAVGDTVADAILLVDLVSADAGDMTIAAVL